MIVTITNNYPIYYVHLVDAEQRLP